MTSHLPPTRVKTIMKSSAEVDVVSQESLLLVTRATELFIKHLALEAVKESDGKKLEYNHLSNYVHKTDKLDFLGEIMPKKITVREFKKRLERAKQQTSSSSGSSSEDSDAHSTSSSSEDDSGQDDDDDEEEQDV